MTHRQYWVLSGASDVVIDGFTMRHAASPAQHGAINVDGHSNWTVRDTTLSDAHGMLVTFEDGAGYQLLDSELARGGETGVGANEASDVLYRGNRIHHNNTEDFDSGWSAGGTKNARVTNLVVEGNEVYANVGPGIWCDVDCVDVVIRQNRVHHNWSQGIQYEISRNALITGNVVWENGWGSREWCFGAGILVQNSHDVAVEDNLLAWNANGLVVISQERGQSWDRVTNTSMRDNTIISTADGPQAHAYCEDWSGVLFERASNNRSSGNRYWYPETEGSDVRFGWGNRGFQRLADFNATSGSNHGKYIDTATMHQVLAATGVPSRPEAEDTATPLSTEPSTPVPSPVPLAERVQKDG